VNLLLLEEGEVTGGRARIDDARARHVVDVLRAAVGTRIRAGIVDGGMGTAIVERIDGAAIELRCELGESAPPRARVDLLLALPRPKVAGRIFAPLAQLGIDRLFLTNASRVERYYFDAHQLDPAYVRARLLEGLAQARDTRLPRVSIHKSFRDVIEDELATIVGARIVADLGAAPPLREACAGAARALVAIGPEGGWTDYERAMLASAGFIPATLGPRTLRSDVAAITAVALAHDALR
jgi:RsmE family RNA methyltransferase